MRPLSPSILLALLTSVALAASRPAAGEDPPPGDPPPPPPNVLVVLLDDVGVDSIGAYGEGAAPPTPNIDALAAGGVLFRNAWGEPICSPSRAALLTGRYGLRTGVGELVRSFNEALQPAEVTIPEMLDAGTGGAYAHAAFGKWHLGNDAVGGALAPNLAGFAHFDGSLENLQAPDSYDAWTRTVDGVQALETTYATTAVADAAIAWIAATEPPWLAYVAFQAAHAPYHAPPEHLHTQDLAGAEPPSVDPRPYYVAMVEALDTELGRLLAALPPDTLVVLAGDNGTPAEVTLAPFLPEHAKLTLFEGGVNVPFVVSGPGVTQPGSESQALVHLADVFATVADAAGVDLAQALPDVALDSVSVLPHAADPALPSSRTSVLAEVFFPNTAGPTPSPPPCGPPVVVCQEDLGLAGAGVATLAICGDELRLGNTAELAIEGVPPFGFAFVLRSGEAAQIPLLGGTFVAWPPIDGMLLVADDAGRATLALPGGGAPLTIWYQALTQKLPGGLGLTNAVRAEYLPGHLTAVRDAAGYKLSSNQYDCGDERFYDLAADPFEQFPLDVTTLEGDALAAYTALEAELAALGLN